MTREEINTMKYKVCCPMCDNKKCVRGTYSCEAEQWAKSKAESYEENNNNSKTDDPLKEGDEIIILDHNSDYHNKKGIITYVSDCGKYTEVLFSDGDFGKYCNGYFKRTGKSYPELANILEQLKGYDSIISGKNNKQ